VPNQQILWLFYVSFREKVGFCGSSKPKSTSGFWKERYWLWMERNCRQILDLNKTGVCPFKKIVSNISEPGESYLSFKVLLEKMKQCR